MKSVIVSVSSKIRMIGAIVFAFCLCMAISAEVYGQRDETTTQTGSIAGNAYSYSDFETINVTNGNLSINFPLGSLPAGRGGTSASYGLTYNSKLFEKYNAQLRKYDEMCKMVHYEDHGLFECPKFNATIIAPKEKSGWQYTGKYELDFENRLDIRSKFTTNDPLGNYNPWPDCISSYGPTPWWYDMTYAWKLRLITPDGSSHEMRPTGHTDVLNDGFFRVRPDGLLESCGNSPLTNPTPVVYHSFDGSFLRLEKSSETDWTIYMADGSRVVNTSTYQRVYDKNGNYIEYTEWERTDQFGRTVGRDGGYHKIVSLGVDGEEIEWNIQWKTIVVKKSYTACEESECPSGEIVRQINEPIDVVSKIIMPDQLGGGEFVFSYNAPDQSEAHLHAESLGWGEISGVTLPSGAEIEYEYSMDEINGTYETPIDLELIFANHPVKKTLTYNADYDGSSTPVVEEWTYSTEHNGGTITNPDGSWTNISSGTTFLPDRFTGLVFSTESSNGTKTENRWEFNVPAGCTGACLTHTANNPYIRASYTSIKDSTGNYAMTSITEYIYDKNGNVLETREYDWIPYSTFQSKPPELVVPSGVTPKRLTKNVYYNDVPEVSSSNQTHSDIYIYNTSPRLLRLPKSVAIEDGSSVVRSRSEITYDFINYDSYNTKAGNPILTRAWDSTKGAVSDPLTDGNSVKTQATYNAYGMPLTTTDANGTVTQITYGCIDGSGSCDDEYKNLYPTQTTAAYGTALARTSTATYDFFTGLVLTTTDEDNDITNAVEYDDLGRPVKSISALGTALESWTTTEYDDDLRRIIVRSDLEAKGDGKKVAIQHFDQLGRVRLARTLENAATESPYNETHGIKVQSRYKASGVCTFDSNEDCTFQLTSNPYRANYSFNETDSTMGWTLSQSRNDGRYSEVQTFAGAALPSAFGGANSNSTGVVKSFSDANASTVEDQAGKKRRSITNALGQLIRVDEPNDAGELGTIASPNQPTSYAYDTLSNLTTVTQGAQTRTFTYSSLSRLLTANNPESGLISYQYDPNGNLTKKTDARNIETDYTYDALNRVVSREYSDTTPDVEYTYKATAPAVGSLIKVESSVSATEYTSFDILGRVTGHKQTTDGEDYTTSYVYDLSGGLVEQTYPSGRKVHNVIDGNTGHLNMVQSRKSVAHGYMNYAQNFTYNAVGAATSMQLGNGKWESTQFNSRLQPTQIALGTVQNTADKLKLEYGYGSTANNGNVLSQKITVNRPSSSPLVFDQSYTYDSLNRLKSAEEVSDSLTTWKQVYTFDRYGNRNFDEEETTTLAKNCIESSQPAMCVADRKVLNPEFNLNNNRTATGQDYTYDAAGNITVDAEGRQFSYDAENKQKEVKNSFDDVIGQYFFDGDGKRVKKVVPDTGEMTIFVYDAGGKLIGEYSTQVAQAPKVQYLTNDHLGSPRIITDENGDITSRTDYMPYGEEITGLGGRSPSDHYATDDIRQGFTGYEKDDETGLDFAQARMYAKHLGRFTAPDPWLSSGKISVPKSWNRYVYVLNNPLIYRDPLGLFIFADDVSEKDRERITKAYNDLIKARDAFEAGSKKYNEINRAIKALGKPGEDNGVIVATSSQIATPGNAYVAPDYDENGIASGTVAAVITLNMSKFTSGANGQAALARTVGHEAIHVANAGDEAMRIKGKGLEEVIKLSKEGKIMSRAIGEVHAYRVTAYIGEALAGNRSQAVKAGDHEIWNRSWSATDQQANMDKGIRQILETTLYNYKFTPNPSSTDNPIDKSELWTVNGGSIF